MRDYTKVRRLTEGAVNGLLAAGVNPSCVILDDEIRSWDPLCLFGYLDVGDRSAPKVRIP